ncbi:MAG: adenylate kinase [Gammaproteobacteria bacterium]|nr:adenylate kinase [Gammaproteobacteria bacterium]
MNVILLGAPGAGKGTIAKLLTDFDGSVQISTGDILRGAVQAGSELGKQAEVFMNTGDLVPDQLIMDIMESRLQASDCQNGFLLDGFPRTMPQAEALKALLSKIGMQLDIAVNLKVSREVILDRLATRRTCSNAECQAIYNVKSNPPKQAGICDKCGSPLIQREDETEKAISHRLKVYNEKTAPLIDFYDAEGLLLSLDATSSDAVISAIKTRLGGGLG